MKLTAVVTEDKKEELEEVLTKEEFLDPEKSAKKGEGTHRISLVLILQSISVKGTMRVKRENDR